MSREWRLLCPFTRKLQDRSRWTGPVGSAMWWYTRWWRTILARAKMSVTGEAGWAQHLDTLHHEASGGGTKVVRLELGPMLALDAELHKQVSRAAGLNHTGRRRQRAARSTCYVPQRRARARRPLSVLSLQQRCRQDAGLLSCPEAAPVPAGGRRPLPSLAGDRAAGTATRKTAQLLGVVQLAGWSCGQAHEDVRADLAC